MQKLTFYTAMLAIIVLPVLMIGPLLSNHGKERLFSVVFPINHPVCTAPSSCGPPELSYREFTLTADANNNASQLQKMQRELQRIRKTNDQRSGVRIRVNDETPFRDYITGLDICKTEFRTFVPLLNDVYVPYGPEVVDFPIVIERLGFE